MKLIKYIFTLLVGATALSLTSCNDFLDRDPLGQFTEDDSPNALVGGKIFNVPDALVRHHCRYSCFYGAHGAQRGLRERQ